MGSLRRRLAAAEARMNSLRPGIISVVIINGPDRFREHVAGSSPGGVRYLREPNESVETFRARARAEAERIGEKIIVFNKNEAGDLPSDGEPNVADLITVTDAPE
jgi:hypothetical protein